MLKNISIEVEKNTILLDAIRKTKLNVEAPCNGRGFCGKCKVIKRGDLSEPTDSERKVIDEERDERLSCMAEILGDVEVSSLKPRPSMVGTC